LGYMWAYWLRRLFLVAVVVGTFAVVAFFIVGDSRSTVQQQYDLQVTIAIETAVANRLNIATRTAEAPLAQFRLVDLANGEALLDVALKYDTTVEALRMANKLLASVDFGTGQTIIVPEGIERLDPPRSFHTEIVQQGDTLSTLATRFSVPLEQLQKDNPVLAGRELLPGDIVFIPELL
jgi:hypothetical protein